MSEHYRLVYMLATREGSCFNTLDVHGEFGNRAAAREYVDMNKFILEEQDIYLVRKEVAVFYDRKLLDKKED